MAILQEYFSYYFSSTLRVLLSNDPTYYIINCTPFYPNDQAPNHAAMGRRRYMSIRAQLLSFPWVRKFQYP